MHDPTELLPVAGVQRSRHATKRRSTRWLLTTTKEVYRLERFAGASASVLSHVLPDSQSSE